MSCQNRRKKLKPTESFNNMGTNITTNGKVQRILQEEQNFKYTMFAA